MGSGMLQPAAGPKRASLHEQGCTLMQTLPQLVHAARSLTVVGKSICFELFQRVKGCEDSGPVLCRAVCPCDQSTQGRPESLHAHQMAFARPAKHPSAACIRLQTQLCKVPSPPYVMQPVQVMDQITEALYEQSMDAQEGVIYFLLDQMADQHVKEAAVAYFVLLFSGAYQLLNALFR